MEVGLRVQQVERRPHEVRTPGALWASVRRLVVVRNDRMGDLLLSLPAVDALRRAYPKARLALMVRRDLVPLAGMVDGVDQVIEAASWHGGRVSRLREFEPDLAVCISRGAAVPWAAFRAGVPRRVGPGYRYYSPLFDRSVREHRSAGLRHEVEYSLSFAHRAGAPTLSPRFPLRIPSEAAQRTRDWLASVGVAGPFVLLHPGSGGSCPAWPADHFERLAGTLMIEGLRVVFSVGPTDALVAQALDRAPSEVRRLPRFTGDIPGLAALASSASALVSNSTGPLHLAAAVGTPTLGIYAPWPTCGVSRWGPYAENGWALVAEPSPAPRWTRRERRRLGFAIMEAVPPRAARDAVLSLLQAKDPA